MVREPASPVRSQALIKENPAKGGVNVERGRVGDDRLEVLKTKPFSNGKRGRHRKAKRENSRNHSPLKRGTQGIKEEEGSASKLSTKLDKNEKDGEIWGIRTQAPKVLPSKPLGTHQAAEGRGKVREHQRMLLSQRKEGKDID